MEFTNEELHYFRVCNIVTRIIPDGLRKIFKQQWDALYTGRANNVVVIRMIL